MFRQFVVKVASRCDLSCDHCYIYEHADQSWRRQPRVMSREVLTSVVKRIAEYAQGHALPSVTVILHGGEPLLAGVERIRFFAERLRAELPVACAADLRIQTNGLRLDDAFCEMFLEQDISVGISIDGDRAANDRHRRYADGRSSYPALQKAIRLLASNKYRSIFKGLLCTIDVENDPVAVFDALAAFQPPRLEFLLPHATWVNPPPAAKPGQAPYARWLLAVHRRWIERGRPMDVRLFSSVADLLARRSSHTEALGLGPAEVVVVETDGAIEQADSLKTAYDGAPATGFDVGRHSFDDAAAHAGFSERGTAVAELSPICQRCPVVRVCGAGLYAHRYDGTGFVNPSVYCEDLYTLIAALAGETRQPSATARHQMSTADFDALSRGASPASAMAVLGAAQLSKARIRLARMSRSRGAGRVGSVVEGFDATHRSMVNRILSDPFLAPSNRTAAGALAVDAPAAATQSAQTRAAQTLAAETLARVAVSCAVLNGGPLTVDLTAVDDVVALPGVGTIAVPSGPCRIAVDAHAAITVDGSPAVLKRTEIRLGPFVVRIEDRDPARDRFGYPVAGTLSATELAAWQRALDGAAKVLAARHPEEFAGMAGAVTTIVPLRPYPRWQRSSTARSAFGALALALPPSDAGEDPAEALASLLLHEFQHVKLGAVLDLFDLHDGSDSEIYPVAWRADERPLEAVLQGVYAHLATAEYWRRRAGSAARGGSDGYSRRAARIERHVAEALSRIVANPALTPLGNRWVSGMAAAAGQRR